MTAPLRQHRSRIDPPTVFIARAEARAALWAAGEITLHDAVDELWAIAVSDGLVVWLGADQVQRALADTFAPARGDLPRDVDVVSDLVEEEIPAVSAAFTDDDYGGLSSTFAKLCREADEKQRRKLPDPRLERLRRLMDDDVSIERAWHEINHPTNRAAASTVEALMLGLRDRGTAALAEGPVRQRLVQLDEEQVVKVGDRLQALQPDVARAWAPAEVRQLLEAWGALRGG
jgi:hypothetical protein